QVPDQQRAGEGVVVLRMGDLRRHLRRDLLLAEEKGKRQKDPVRAAPPESVVPESHRLLPLSGRSVRSGDDVSDEDANLLQLPNPVANLRRLLEVEILRRLFHLLRQT